MRLFGSKLLTSSVEPTSGILSWLVALATFCLTISTSASDPLTTLEYRVNGTGLQVSPAVVSVPKGIAGSVMVTLVGGEATQVLAAGAYVEAFLRGPGFPEPRRIVSQVNQPMLFPPLNLVGDYQLDSIRLVDAVTGATRMEGNPAIVPVRVFDEILVSRVTSRPLTYEEIVEKGIFIDESNFRVVEFEAAFVLDGKTIPILFPVVAPKFTDSIELIPAAELEEKLAEAAVLNQQIASTTQLPPEFEVSQLNIEVQGINFQVVDPGEDEPLGLNIPPIPALMVIPGNIGFLNQFFSVMIFTENAAPLGSGLSVYDISATLKLPPGPDRLVSTNYTAPGDDPLRFARIGPDKLIQPVQHIVQVGRDGELGTSDDNPRLQPGQSGQAEFLVEGLQEGLHVMDLDLEATMDGLAAGPVRVKGKAAGSVLVRNPRFSMAFSHPRTVRVGEPYEASVTLLNTGITPANLVQISLNKNSISGARLENEDQQTVELGTLMPGESKTATFKLRSLRNGAVSFSNLTTSDDSVVGRFRLSMGVDERGVALSPDTLAMPDQVNSLPPALLFAANRVLGQALSIATAGQVPPGVTRVGKSIISRRVLDLAEAGQRINYGDPAQRVYADLMRDWQGGREASAGFDQILRETEAGREWREALFAAMEAADGLDATARIADRAADYAGLGQEFAVGGASTGQLRADYGDGKAGATIEKSTQPYALAYPGTNGVWVNTPVYSNTVFIWTFTNGPPTAEIAALIVSTNGTARQLRWTIANPPVDATYAFALSDSVLRVDLLSDGAVDSTLPATVTTVSELPPQLIAVEQDLFVVAGRPSNPCIGPEYRNYGQIVAVVFSKPMTQDLAGNPDSYIVDGDNGANSVSVQPGGRVAYLNLRKGISAIRPRTLTLGGVTDVRGNVVTATGLPIRCVEPGTEDVPFKGGVAIRGRALKGDGSPAVGIPVTLTMYDQAWGPYSCEAYVRRVSQVFTDSGGNFDFDFVLAGVPYSISATDTSGLSGDALSLIAQNTVEGQVEREKILQLATSASTRDTLLGLLAAGSIPEAIAKVEGLDRALVRDSVPVGSPREGQTVPIALRFRGRATVVGQVVAADGTTPMPRAAVNLFPDSGSRELGRGIFADGDGRFAFYGVPLGVYTVEVQTSDRRNRTVAGLLDTPGEVESIVVALPNTETPLGSLRGTVFEADNLTPHGGARVFIGQLEGGQVKNVVRIIDADSSGNWRADGLPVRNYDVVAISFDGKRKGTRVGFTVVEGALSVANLALESTTVVFGRVQFDDGRPAPNALVAGGLTLVRTDASGNFTLEGVPVGSRMISAGLERNPAAGIDFPRLGSAQVNVIAGAENYVVVKLRPAGKIFGRVTDLNGNGIGGIRVAIPVEGGFYWTDADSRGNYVFENLGLGSYILSAPANATSPQLDVPKLTEQIRSGNEDEILAAFEEAVRVFIGADDPLVTGEQNSFRPVTWGFTNSRLQFDGQSVEANIRMMREGTVTGKVLNHQGVPIGARVRLNGLGPDKAGAPKITIRGERDSDPATGLFIFPRSLLTGAWTLQAASPFYPTVIQVGGYTTDIDPNVTNVVLQFPPIQDFNGRLVGQVFNPDGTLVGDGVRVKISFSDDYEIQTDEFGFFDTQIMIPAGNYRVEAIDDASGLRGEAYVRVSAGITNQATVQLLTRNSAVEVSVVRGNGLPAVGARVDLEHGTYPREGKVTLFADTNGFVRFTDLWEGRYAVRAEYTEGSIKVSARGGATVAANQTGSVTLRLGGTGSIGGRFVKLDQATPVDGAQVAIGNLGFATTDALGRFLFEGVPLGTYQLTTSDPVTGAFARGVASVTVVDQVVDVLLIEGARGEINGYVIDSYGQEYVPGATVRVNFSDGLTPSRTVTTGPDGRFNFPGSPVGNFTLSAKDRLIVDGGRGTSGSAAGSLSASLLTVSVNIPLQPLGTLPVNVVREDGVTPASNVTVRLAGRQLDTDESGAVRFENLGLGSYGITAISRIGGELRNGASLNATVAQVGTNPPVTIRLPGVGTVRGMVVGSDGMTPVSGAEVVITFRAPVFANQTVTAVSGTDGRFEYADVPVGEYRLTAASVSLAASAIGNIGAGDEVDDVTLRLGDSGVVVGRLVRADGITPVGGIDVLLTYASQSPNPGRAFIRSAADGAFEFVNIPVGSFNLEAVAAAFGGLIKRAGALTANGQRVDLGALLFDEEFPRVLSVIPADTTDEVPIATQVRLEFSEALAASSITTNGMFIRSVLNGSRVAANVQLLETNGVARVVTISPQAPLVSEQVYEVVVIAGELLNGTGGVIGAGPRDLVGRALTVPFVSRFRTADNDPPVLLSLFPSNNAVQIDPRSVPRLSFNESLRPSGFNMSLSGPGGLVAGTASLGVDGRVLSFVPNDVLQVNATYTLTVSNVFDVAGNRAAGEPFVAVFKSLDTVGPRIVQLGVADGRPLVAGAVVPVEAALEVAETGATVRYTQDFQPIGSSSIAPFRRNVTLPASGSTTIRAIATDQYGNDGPVAETVLTVQPNQPPTISFARVTPLTGPILSGAFVAVDVTANDDSGITELKAVATGFGAGGLVTTNGRTIRFQGAVPASAGPGSQIQIFAEVTDDVGQGSGQQVFTFNVSDGTKPSVLVGVPAEGTVITPGATVPVSLALADNFGVSEVTLTVSGAFSNQLQRVLSPVVSNGVTALDLVVPAGTPADGGAVVLAVSARDAAGNVSATATRALRMNDGTPPGLLSVSPANGATGVDPLVTIRLDFNEALASNTVVAANFRLEPDAGGESVPVVVRLENGGRRVVLTVSEPLRLDATFRLTVGNGITDVAGNPLGAAFTSTFRTSDFRIVQPSPDQKVVEGATIVVEASSPTTAYETVRFLANGTEFARDVAAPFLTNYAVPTITSLGTNRVELVAQAVSTNAGTLPEELVVLAQASVTIEVFPGAADSDGDGISNAEEIARGWDPFTPNLPPVITVTNYVELVEGHPNEAMIPFSVSDAEAPVRIWIRESLSDEFMWQFDRFVIASAGQPDWDPRVVQNGPWADTIRLRSPAVGQTQIYLRAMDPFGLMATNVITVVTLADLDGDLIPDRDDSDVDGDGLSNADELVRGTDPRKPDTDGDGLNDNVEIAMGTSGGAEGSTVLTFDIGGISDFQNINPSYGDRVTTNLMGSFSYGGSSPFTPNITVSYGANDPALWTRGYGSLTNILFENQDNTGVLTVTLTADDGYAVNLSRFDLSAYTSVFSSDPSIALLEVLNQNGTPVYSRSNQIVSRTTFTGIEFSPPLSGRTLTIRVDARNLGGLNDDIALDNIEFGQRAIHSSPLIADTDGDGVPDGFEMALGLDPSNPRDASPTVVIDNRTVSFSGLARFHTLILTNGAVLTHDLANLGVGVNTPRGLELILTNLIIDGTSRIDASAKGCLGGLRGANAGSSSGRTYGNVAGGGSMRRNGGSYGGVGGFGSAEAFVNPTYGDFRDPNELGSGGGSDSDPAGNGGGLIRITVGSAEINGQILANGGGGSTYGGGGSGGAIRLVAETLAGSGGIRANGGSTGSGQPGGGGGGRVALIYQSAADGLLANVEAFGGGGRNDGSAGTVYFKRANQEGELMVDGGRPANLALATPLTTTAGGTVSQVGENWFADRTTRHERGALRGREIVFGTNSSQRFRVIDNRGDHIFTDPATGRLSDFVTVGAAWKSDIAVGRLDVRGGSTVEIVDSGLNRFDRRGRLFTRELELSENAWLTHPFATTVSQFGIELTVTNVLSVSTNSRIDVSGRGYLGGLSGANFANQIGRTLGNTTVGGSLRRNGGSYGGLGGFGSAEAFANAVYGSYRDPNELGSGGGSDSDPAGNGGGLLRLNVGTLRLEGQILANGGPGSSYGGGGSGGGVKITAGTLGGGGSIQANGGSTGSGQPGGGGGGRIAVYYTTVGLFDFATQLQAVGGRSGIREGTPGTIYVRGAAGTLEQLVVDAFGTNAPVAFTPLLSLSGRSHSALAANILTDTNASFDPGSLIGLRLKLGAFSPVTFRVVANSTNSITTDPADGSLLTAAGSDGTYSAELAVGAVVIRGGAKVQVFDADKAQTVRRGRLHAVNIGIATGGILSHPPATITSEFGLEITADDLLSVDALSRIDAGGLGYLGARNGGNGGNDGRTAGNTTTGGSTRRNGGGYGGSGGFGTAGGSVNLPYGTAQDPNEPGSGGGSDSDVAGSGGGVIHVVAANFVLDGHMLASGMNGGSYAGGGSGGAIKVATRNWTGAGEIRANGGLGGGQGGGGGGGRVAIYHENVTTFPVANVTALGAGGNGTGNGGSVVVQEAVFVPPAGVVAFVPVAESRPRIEEIAPVQQGTTTGGIISAASSQPLVVRWVGRAGGRYVVETSTDLRQWHIEPVIVTESAPGRFEAIWTPRAASAARFVRVGERAQP